MLILLLRDAKNSSARQYSKHLKNTQLGFIQGEHILDILKAFFLTYTTFTRLSNSIDVRDSIIDFFIGTFPLSRYSWKILKKNVERRCQWANIKQIIALPIGYMLLNVFCQKNLCRRQKLQFLALASILLFALHF